MVHHGLYLFCFAVVTEGFLNDFADKLGTFGVFIVRVEIKLVISKNLVMFFNLGNSLL